MNDVYVKYKNLSEEDTKRIEITPAITNKGWHSETQIRMAVKANVTDCTAVC